MTHPTAPAADEQQVTWRCFHCDELFTDRQCAADHFGISELDGPPVCVVAATEEQRAIIEDRRDWRNRALRAEEEAEQKGYEAHLLRFDMARGFKGAKSINEVRLLLDELEGRVLSLTERIEWVPRWIRRAFTPKGYFS